MYQSKKRRVLRNCKQAKNNRRWLVVILTGASFVVSACSSSSESAPTHEGTAAAPAITFSSAVTTSAPATPDRVTLDKDWKEYGGTVYYGCPDAALSSAKDFSDIRPKILNTKTGTFLTPAVPGLAEMSDATAVACTLAGDESNLRVVYLINSTKEAHGLEPVSSKTTAYLYELDGIQPVSTRELPLLDTETKVAPTATGAVLTRYEDTTVLSEGDLSTLWTAPGGATVWEKVVSFKRYRAKTSSPTTYGIELRSPEGEILYQNDDMWYVDAVLSDGNDTLVDMVFWNSYSPARTSTMFFDITTRSMIKIAGSEQVPGRGYKVTLSDGQLLVEGNSDEATAGLEIWNLRTSVMDFRKTTQEVSALSLWNVSFFQNHLYITSGENNFSVIALPDTKPIASSWTSRPFGRIPGWTFACQGAPDSRSPGNCKQTVLIVDKNGKFPGPWT